MNIKNQTNALAEHLTAANELVQHILRSSEQMTGLPVSLDQLPAEISRRIEEYDLSISLLSEQSGVAINTVKKAISNPETMKIQTLQRVIEPLGLSLCFERQ